MKISIAQCHFSANVLLFACVAAISCSLFFSYSAGAISGWQAGNIISDSVMTNNSSMSRSQIQSFLNNQVPSCDTYGKKLSEYGGPDINGDGKVQRWEWGKDRFNQTKFVCLKNYSQNGKSAARIIKEVSDKYRINPQVLLVLLQKEQGLVRDTWPLNIQYRSATGYGCPDTAPCDSQYYGLTNQLDWAAKMFRSILDDSPYWYTPYETGWNYIQYSPIKSCGGSNVYIKNRATQALYNYTPYQPNKGALNAGWGTAPCGAYGNRNFYLYFTNWFGSTRKSNFASMETKRWMVLKNSVYKYNPFTQQRVDGQLSAGTQLKFVSKTYVNGKWYLRTKWDHDRHEIKAIPLENIGEINYEPMATPRLMQLNTDANKLNPRSGSTAEKMFSKGMTTFFDEKMSVNNKVYLRSKYDSDNNNVAAFKLYQLDEFSFESMEKPRWMTASQQVSVKDISTSQLGTRSSDITKHSHVYFVDKLNLQGEIYLKARDLSNNETQLYPLSSFTNLPLLYEPMETPRALSLRVDTWKINPETENRINPNNPPFEKDLSVEFTTKIKINGKWYLRSKYDTTRKNNAVIPFELLQEVTN